LELPGFCNIKRLYGNFLSVLKLCWVTRPLGNWSPGVKCKRAEVRTCSMSRYFAKGQQHVSTYCATEVFAGTKDEVRIE